MNNSEKIESLVEVSDRIILQEDSLIPPFFTLRTVKDGGFVSEENKKFIQENITKLQLVSINNNSDDMISIVLKLKF
jgi:hypothetical protein